MSMKFILMASILAIATGCANKTKTTAAPTTPSTTQSSATTAKATTPATATGTTTATSAPVNANSTVKLDVYNCSREVDVRNVYIEPLAPTGCKLWYSNKKDSPIAQSARSIEYCEKVNANIRKNLEAAGFECKELTITK